MNSMKKKYIAVLLCALLFCGLIGCASTEPTQNSTDGSASLLQEATNWFESQTSKYEILSAEAVNDSAIFLTGTKNPDTDEYQLLWTEQITLLRLVPGRVPSEVWLLDFLFMFSQLTV